MDPRYKLVDLSLLISIKEARASHPRGARAREIHFLQILYSTIRRTSHHSRTPADLGISIYTGLVFLVRAGRSHAPAFTELAKHKGCEICVWYRSTSTVSSI
jgi:hypothetical protein